ncbi:MAG: transposase [Candidatus Entotheonellia bacterium]
MFHFADIFFPEPAQRGRGMPHTPFRKVVHTLLYVLITGCRWCDLPREPPWASKSAAHRGLQRAGRGMAPSRPCKPASSAWPKNMG